MPIVIRDEAMTVPVGDLAPHPGNPRQGDIGAIYESIIENGLYGRVLVQKSSMTIIAGEHRWRAAKEAGIVEIPVLLLDVDDTLARRIMLVDNRTNDLAAYDDSALAGLLKSMAASGEGLAGTGYDEDSLGELMRLLGDDGSEDGGAGTPMEVKSQVLVSLCGVTAMVGVEAYEAAGRNLIGCATECGAEQAMEAALRLIAGSALCRS